MIRHTKFLRSKYRIGLQRKDKNYTFLHWLEHSSSTSRFKYLTFNRALTEYKPIGPTILVEWEDE